LLPATSPIIAALASLAKGRDLRRHLHDGSLIVFQRLLQGQGQGRGGADLHYAGGIQSVAAQAELDFGQIGFVALREVADEFGGPTHRYRQDASGRGVESAKVAHFRAFGKGPADPIDHVMGSHPGGFEYIEKSTLHKSLKHNQKMAIALLVNGMLTDRKSLDGPARAKYDADLGGANDTDGAPLSDTGGAL
jgi:hypothetical protein